MDGLEFRETSPPKIHLHPIPTTTNRHMDASNSLFDKPFEVTMVNPDGKKFDRVSRLVCKGTTDNVDLVVDINVEVWPVKTGDKLKIMLCRTLAVEGGVDTGEYNQTGKVTLLDKYDYGMHGKVFHFDYDSGNSQTVSVYISFGGLLMRIQGNQRHVASIKKDMRLYCLMKKELSRKHKQAKMGRVIMNGCKKVV